MARLLEPLTSASVTGDTSALSVESVTSDSRDVRPGTLFVAVRGVAGDGHDYIAQAVSAGATAVCGEADVADLSVPYIKVGDSRLAVALLAERLAGEPSQALRVVGVTGTNGKTSTVTLTRQLMEDAGTRTALIGTVQYVVGDRPEPAPNTTPGPVQLSQLLAKARDGKREACVMEVSSHALDQQRVAGIEFDIAVFTNCTQDHLDYHETMEAYFAAKRRLFEALGSTSAKSFEKRAIVNADDPYADRVIEACRVPVWTYGIDAKADLSASDIRLALDHTTAEISTPQGSAQVRLRLLGRHNVSNALAALGAAMAAGVPFDTAVASLEQAPCVPGRCETVIAGQDYGVIVDYAHTPDGLRALLETCRALQPRKLLVVFGCGGDRDRTKRPQMGELVARDADFAIVTSDNPRTEDPLAILMDIEVGLQHAGAERDVDYVLIEDRRAAIAKAISLAETGDLVVIAGKGHEDYQIVGTERRDFDDRAVARELLVAEQSGGAC